VASRRYQEEAEPGESRSRPHLANRPSREKGGTATGAGQGVGRGAGASSGGCECLVAAYGTAPPDRAPGQDSVSGLATTGARGQVAARPRSRPVDLERIKVAGG